jgi:hypothetical protein
MPQSETLDLRILRKRSSGTGRSAGATCVRLVAEDFDARESFKLFIESFIELIYQNSRFLFASLSVL